MLQGADKNCGQVFNVTKSKYIRKPGDTQPSSSTVNGPIASKSPGILKASSRQIGSSGKPDARRRRNSNPDAVLKDSKRMLYWMDVQGNLSRQKKDQEPLELSGDWRCRETCRTRTRRISRKPRTSRKIRRLGNRGQNLTTSFPCITRLCTSHGESLLDRKTDLWSTSDG